MLDLCIIKLSLESLISNDIRSNRIFLASFILYVQDPELVVDKRDVRVYLNIRKKRLRGEENILAFLANSTSMVS